MYRTYRAITGIQDDNNIIELIKHGFQLNSAYYK